MDSETKTLLATVLTLAADLADQTAELMSFVEMRIQRNYVAAFRQKAHGFQQRAKEVRAVALKLQQSKDQA